MLTSPVALFVLALLSLFTPVKSTQDSWPQVYPGMPAIDYGPEWQKYFQVTENLPNVSWSLARNWAGNVPVQRQGHPNNTLFFWAFESSNGSFTANSDKPWGIWLNGGPGASSLAGFLLENGPIHVASNYSVFENQYAWSTVADYVWIDQPVGTGFSTVDPSGNVVDEDQLARDFMGFLENFVKVFPNLATRPLHLTGESYVGVFAPYIAKAYFGMDNPPVHLSTIAIGNGAITTEETSLQVPVVSVLETYPQIIGYDTEVYEYFKEQSSLCGYNLILQYPQPGQFPTLHAPVPVFLSAASFGQSRARLTKAGIMQEAQNRLVKRFGERGDSPLDHTEKFRARDAWKRDLAGRANGTIDPWYQCDLYDEMVDYATNYTFPWNLGLFDIYNVPDALSPEVPMDASVFLNDPQTRAAIHAPTSKDWYQFTAPFLPTNSSTNVYGDPSVAPMAFLTDLATNATAYGVKIVIYSGRDDSFVPHFGSEIAIQNTTFGGIQGFTYKPATPWHNDDGDLAGVVHQERNWTYVLVQNAGHLLAHDNPVSALTLAREFIFGNNKAGLVTSTGLGTVGVIGGELSSPESEMMAGQAAIYYGNAMTQSSYSFPSATVEAWYAYMGDATPAP